MMPKTKQTFILQDKDGDSQILLFPFLGIPAQCPTYLIPLSDRKHIHFYKIEDMCQREKEVIAAFLVST